MIQSFHILLKKNRSLSLIICKKKREDSVDVTSPHSTALLDVVHRTSINERTLVRAKFGSLDLELWKLCLQNKLTNLLARGDQVSSACRPLWRRRQVQVVQRHRKWCATGGKRPISSPVGGRRKTPKEAPTAVALAVRRGKNNPFN